MSAQLRNAIDAATPEELEKVRTMLADAADLTGLSGAPESLLYRALLDDLDAPARTYRTALVAICTSADSAVDGVVGDLLSIGEPLPFALARELGAAARMSRDLRAGFTRQLDATEGP